MLDKKERLNLSHLTKEQLQANDKKRILELFVENDNTLSHLLEFISGKLIEDEDVQGPSGVITTNQTSQSQSSKVKSPSNAS